MTDLASELISALPFMLNGYKFEKVIGKGSLGTVFEAYSERWSSTFAIKVTPVDESLITPDGRLRDPELGALISLDSPNIIRFYDYFVYQDNLFLVLEYCSFGTLQSIIHGIGLDIPTARVVISELCQALFYCHEQNIAHRDIKPSNIFIDNSAHVKLADFGLSSFSMDKVTTKCGTPNYAAPEIFTETEIDPYRADVFSLGVVCYEIITGKLPFPEGDLEKRGPVDLVDIQDKKLAHIVEMMMDHTPSKRPTMKQLTDITSSLCLVSPETPEIKKRGHRYSLPLGHSLPLPINPLTSRRLVLRKPCETKQAGERRLSLTVHLSQQHLISTSRRASRPGILSAKNVIPKNPRAKLEQLCRSQRLLNVEDSQ